MDIFRWAGRHALHSGVVAEHLNPSTRDPISDSPLTWSHAELATTVCGGTWRHAHEDLIQAQLKDEGGYTCTKGSAM